MKVNIFLSLFLAIVTTSHSLPAQKHARRSISDRYENPILFQESTGNNGNINKSAFLEFIAKILLNRQASIRNTFKEIHQPRIPSKDNTYEDKILFREEKKNSLGYIRRFPPYTSNLNTPLKNDIPFRNFDIEDIILVPDQNSPIQESNENNPPMLMMRKEIRNSDTQNTKSQVFTEDTESNSTESVTSTTISILEDSKGKNSTEIQEVSTTEKIPPGNKKNDIAFHSLFRVPDIVKKEDRDQSSPCPENLRRNHHGECVRPIRRFRIRIVEETD